MNKNNLVWYACYGSNMLKERFMCYVKGGISRHNGKPYNGCTDKRDPIDEKPITIHHELYFGKKSYSWSNGGVAFLDPHPNQKCQTFGKMYLIAKEQFNEIQKQEGSSESWYGHIIELDEFEGVKIMTFTSKLVHERTNPSPEYRQVIIEGLTETYPQMTSIIVAQYLGF